ncbi:hypothetical protein P9112_003339 [Eukaryota sp. TZLM1-RC]
MPPPSRIEVKSAAAFFSENKNIAGFDNAGKSLYTTIREFVENSLDAAEAVPALPEIDLTIEEIPLTEFNDLIGVSNTRRRKNEDIYVEQSEDPVEDSKPKRGRKKTQSAYFRITCSDNGTGLDHDDVPNAFGRVLAGTKYGVRQTRGKFGLGAKMALIWSKMSTGLPITIETAKQGRDITRCVLDIDIKKNQPNVQEHVRKSNLTGWRGTKISVVIEGAWVQYRARVVNYMRQLAIITPHAQFSLQYVPGSAGSSAFSAKFKRRSDVIPPPPGIVQHHPRSVNLVLVKQLIQDSKNKTLGKFLQNDFQCVNTVLSGQICAELGHPKTTKLGDLSDADIASLVKLFGEIKFPDPLGNCLSPAGEYNLRLGIMKELNPQFVATYQHAVSVFEGHPFIVEAGVSIGGQNTPQGINIYRFANRIPLLFEQGNDVVTLTAKRDIKWGNYKIKHTQDKVGVFVSIVSTRIPFKGTGKEYIGDDCSEIKEAVKHAITQCCSQLKVKLVAQQTLKARGERKKNLVKFVPDVSRAIHDVLSDIQDSSMLKEKDLLLLDKVKKGSVSERTLAKQLELYVEKTDAEQALDYAAEQGRVGAKLVDFFLVSVGKKMEDFSLLGNPKLVFGVSNNVITVGDRKQRSSGGSETKKTHVDDSEWEFSE